MTRSRQTTTVVELRKVRLDKIIPNPHFAPPIDERLVELIARVLNGDAPSWRTTVPVADLGVHHPPMLDRIRAVLREEPSLHAGLLKHVLENRLTWVVYRDESGQLVMFDDYATYCVAQEIGLEHVDVQILGEPRPA